MKTYTMFYGYNDGTTGSKTLHFDNDLIAMIEAPMHAINYDYWMLLDERHNGITRFMPTWGDTQVTNNLEGIRL